MSGKQYEFRTPAFAGVSGRYEGVPYAPLIPAHSRPKDGVLPHVNVGIQRRRYSA